MICIVSFNCQFLNILIYFLKYKLVKCQNDHSLSEIIDLTDEFFVISLLNCIEYVCYSQFVFDYVLLK